MNLELDKILKSAEYVFDGVKDAEQAIEYVRVLVDKFHQRDSKNALVQIHAPDTVMISQADLNELTAMRDKYEELKVSYNALSFNYDEMYNKYHDAGDKASALDLANKEKEKRINALTTELEHLRKSGGMCQLDASGACTFCEKRVILASVNRLIKRDNDVTG